MIRRSTDPIVALDESIVAVGAYLPWDYDRPEVPAVVEDLVPRATRAHKTVSELMLLTDSWEPTGEDMGEIMLLEQLQELLRDWRE